MQLHKHRERRSERDRVAQKNVNGINIERNAFLLWLPRPAWPQDRAGRKSEN